MCDQLHGWRLANRFAVPGTGQSGRSIKWLRGPRNIGVKKELLATVGTLKGQKFPPDNYDDIRRSTIYDRSWKRFRLTKWKEAT